MSHPQGNSGRGRKGSGRQNNPPSHDAFPNIRHFNLQDIVRRLDATDFRKIRNVLQPIFMASIQATKATHSVLVLSDTGSTVAFTVKSFMTEIGIIPSGLWRGHLETVNETK